MSLIEVRNLHFKYTSKDLAINGLDLDIEKGEFVCILGHNGSGKSTLAKLLVGLLKASEGTIKINDIELSEETVDEIRKHIGIVFQNPDNQFVGITVKDDIAFGLENRQVPRDKMLELIDYYSSKVRMNEFLDKNPEKLSGGEKQRVAIAGVLAMEPEIIIFDEATSMLDPLGVREVMEVMNGLKSKKTLITITHNLNEAMLADKVIVMNDGKIAACGTVEEVFKNYQVLIDSKLDILDSMKILNNIKDSNINNKEEVIKALWELSYNK